MKLIFISMLPELILKNNNGHYCCRKEMISTADLRKNTQTKKGNLAKTSSIITLQYMN